MSTFSGSGKDCSFGRWKHEARCLEADDRYSPSTVLEAVRKSLKTPAADALPRLGVNPTLDQVIKKLESTYGSVLSGEVLLERFYSSKQTADENCAKWSNRIEDLVYQALDKKALSEEAVPGTLRQRFWSGLHESSIKDALRHRYQTLTFEEVITEARVIEEEKTDDPQKDKEKGKVKSHQVTESADSKMDVVIKKLQQMEADIQELKKEKSKPSESQSKGPVKCTKCSLEGHFFWGCRKDQDVECHRCGAKGHLGRACRNKRQAEN